MKKIILLITLVSCYQYGFAQDAKFIKAMEKNVAMIDTAKTQEEYQLAANAFERIANVQPKEWLAHYYVAFCDAMIANFEQNNDKVDGYCDKAEAEALKADSLSPNNSEVYAVRSFISSSLIKVNPMMRGQKYGMEARTYGMKATEIDSLNPRPYFLKAQGLFYTPAAFGGGADKACPILQKAKIKFDAFKPASSIAPHWGKKRTEMLLEECNKTK